MLRAALPCIGDPETALKGEAEGMPERLAAPLLNSEQRQHRR